MGKGSDALGHVALGGKRLRGSAPADHDGDAGMHLIAPFSSRLSAVIVQIKVELDGNEITAALALLKSLPLRGDVVTVNGTVRSFKSQGHSIESNVREIGVSHQDVRRILAGSREIVFRPRSIDEETSSAPSKTEAAGTVPSYGGAYAIPGTAAASA